MKILIVEGRLAGAEGCAVSVILMRRGQVIASRVQNAGFHDEFNVDTPAEYTLLLHGTTTGRLTLTITGDGINCDPPTPKEYTGDILDDYAITT